MLKCILPSFVFLEKIDKDIFSLVHSDGWFYQNLCMIINPDQSKCSDLYSELPKIYDKVNFATLGFKLSRISFCQSILYNNECYFLGELDLSIRVCY